MLSNPEDRSCIYSPQASSWREALMQISLCLLKNAAVMWCLFRHERWGISHLEASVIGISSETKTFNVIQWEICNKESVAFTFARKWEESMYCSNKMLIKTCWTPPSSDNRNVCAKPVLLFVNMVAVATGNLQLLGESRSGRVGEHEHQLHIC